MRPAPGHGTLPRADHVAQALARLPPGPAATTPCRAAVLVPLWSCPPGVLLTCRAAHLRRHAGQVAFPGGRIDPTDASPEAAALREAEEEIALPPAASRLLGRLPTLHTGTGFHIVPVVALVQGSPPLIPAQTEVAAIFTLDLATLLDPASPVERALPARADGPRGWCWPHPVHTIWGATAAMLRDLAHALRAAQAAAP